MAGHPGIPVRIVKQDGAVLEIAWSESEHRMLTVPHGVRIRHQWGRDELAGALEHVTFAVDDEDEGWMLAFCSWEDVHEALLAAVKRALERVLFWPGKSPVACDKTYLTIDTKLLSHLGHSVLFPMDQKTPEAFSLKHRVECTQ